MLADLLPHRRSWLRDFIDPFLLHLTERRYTRGTLLYNARLLAAFADFAEQPSGGDVAQLCLCVNPFVATMRGGDQYRWRRRSRLARFLRFLQQAGLIPATPGSPLSRDDVLVRDHLQALREQRAFVTPPLECTARFARHFSAFWLPKV